MSGCLRNDVFVHSQVTILKAEPQRPLLWELSQSEKIWKKKKNPVLDFENVYFCNSTLYLLLLSGIITPNIYWGRTDSLRFKCSFWEKKEKHRNTSFPLGGWGAVARGIWGLTSPVPRSQWPPLGTLSLSAGREGNFDNGKLEPEERKLPLSG